MWELKLKISEKTIQKKSYNFNQAKHSQQFKRHVKEIKDKLQAGEKIFANHTFDLKKPQQLYVKQN